VFGAPTPAPQSRVCQFPSSGNVIWYIDSTLRDRCAGFNNPRYTATNSTPCQVSENCVTVAASLFCSQFCGAYRDNAQPLQPCKDSCANYTKCTEESPCLPSLDSLGTSCADINSGDTNSSSHCTFLSVNLPRFSDGKDGFSQAGASSRASESSIFFQGAAILHVLLRQTGLLY